MIAPLIIANRRPCHSPSPGGDLSRLGNGERNLSRQSGTKVAQRPSERARASQRRDEGELNSNLVGRATRAFSCAAVIPQKRPTLSPFTKIVASSLIKGFSEKNFLFFCAAAEFLPSRMPLCHFYQTNPFREFATLYLSMRYKNKAPAWYKKRTHYKPIQTHFGGEQTHFKAIRIERSH